MDREAGSGSPAPTGGAPLLLFAPPAGGTGVAPEPGGRLAELLAEALAALGRRVVTVEPGERFRALGDGRYAVPPTSEEGFRALLEALGDTPPAEVVHAWTLGPGAPPAGCRGELATALETGFYSLLFLARALGRACAAAEAPTGEVAAGSGADQPGARGIGLTVLTDRLEAITPAEALVPEKAAMLGLVRVLPQEHPRIAARALGVQLPGGSGPGADASLGHLARALAREIVGRPTHHLVAFRGRQRWVPDFEPVRIDGVEGDRLPLRRGGVYLVTGGPEGNGLALAKILARDWQARLALLEPPGAGGGAEAEARGDAGAARR